jgi:hypothetical protein
MPRASTATGARYELVCSHDGGGLELKTMRIDDT